MARDNLFKKIFGIVRRIFSRRRSRTNTPNVQENTNHAPRCGNDILHERLRQRQLHQQTSRTRNSTGSRGDIAATLPGETCGQPRSHSERESQRRSGSTRSRARGSS